MGSEQSKMVTDNQPCASASASTPAPVPTSASTSADGLLSVSRPLQTLYGPDTTSSRPIPPPMSREYVLAQFKTVTKFIAISEHEDSVYGATQKIPAGDFKALAAARDLQCQTPNTRSTDIHHENHKRARSSPQPATDPFKGSGLVLSKESSPPIKKRRLQLGTLAVRIAEEIPPISIPPTNRSTSDRTAQNTSPTPSDDVKPIISTAFEEDEIVDEGYFTGTPSPLISNSSEIENGEAVEGLLQLHKQSHGQKSLSDDEWLLLSSRSIKNVPDHVEQAQTEKEDQYALRSKQLRESRRGNFCETAAADDDDDDDDDDQGADDAVEPLKSGSSSFLQKTLALVDERPAKFRSVRFQSPVKEIPQPARSFPTSRLRRSPSTDVEHLLDVAAEHVSGSNNSGEDARERGRHCQRHEAPQVSQNPYSRGAAEKFRTQNRHTESGAPNRYAVNEDRLRAAQQGHVKPIYRATSTTVSPTVPLQFSQPTKLETKISKRAEELADKWKADERDDPKLISTPIHEMANIDPTNVKALKAERKRLRELGRDINNLHQTYNHLAIMQAADCHGTKQMELIEPVRRVAVQLLHERLPHQAVYQEIKRLEEQTKRHIPLRLRSFNPMSVYEDVKEFYHEFSGDSRAKLIQCALEKIPLSIDKITGLIEAENRRGIEEKAARKRAAKNHARSKAPDRADRDHTLDKDDQTSNVKAKKSGKVKKLSKLQHLSNLLAQYKTAAEERERQGDVNRQQVIEGQIAQVQAQMEKDDSSGEESEEDTDGEGYYGAGQPSSSTLSQFSAGYDQYRQRKPLQVEQDNEDEQDQQEDAAVTSTVSGQTFDERLAYRNRLATLDREGAASVDPDEVLVDLASGASDDDSESSDDKETDRQAYKYTVHGTFYGLEDYQDGDFELGSYLQEENAESRLRVVIQNLKALKGGEYAGDFRLVTETRQHVVVEQTATFGDGIVAKVWIEKKVIDLSERQARRLRRKIPRELAYQWIVDWHKEVTTTTTTMTTFTAPSHPPPKGVSPCTVKDVESDDLDNLFSSPPPTTAGSFDCSSKANNGEPMTRTEIQTATEHIQPSLGEVDFYTNPYHASLRAKEVYIDWYATFCPAHERPSVRWPEYRGMLGQEEAAKRAEVEGVMDVEGAVVGPWEAEFERPEEEFEEDGTGDDGVRKVVRRVRIVERMCVRVVKNRVKGPRN